MLIRGDARALPLKDESVQMCCTSPPYWGLRDYGTPGQLGLKKTPEEYVAKMVAVFREVRRALKKDGVLWLNLGDSYNGNSSHIGKIPDGAERGHTRSASLTGGKIPPQGSAARAPGLKSKDLVGIPWRVAFALQADGWYLRSDIIWAKPNPMPESVTDRPTKAHEYIFLMSKNAKYYYDADAINERPVRPEWAYETPTTPGNGDRNDGGCTQRRTDKQRGHSRRHAGFNDRWDHMSKYEQTATGRNKRTVWNIATFPYPGSHFATFPEEIPRLCILAGSRPGDVVLDPFGGSGTTAKVALELGRKPIHIDLTYHELARKRMTTTPAMVGLM